MIDPRTVLSLGSACRRASIAFQILSNEISLRDWAEGRPTSDEALDAAYRALELESAAQHLQAQAQDAELLSWLAHRAAGGSVILVAARPVVVPGGERAAEPETLVQRLGRALARPFHRRAA